MSCRGKVTKILAIGTAQIVPEAPVPDALARALTRRKVPFISAGRELAHGLALGEILEFDWEETGGLLRVTAIVGRAALAAPAQARASAAGSTHAAAPARGATPTAADGNPYNFVEWSGSAAWPASAPAEATHDREHGSRHSGTIDVAFHSRTPLFTPSSDDPQRFFECWDGEALRCAFPGSSVKGAVRTVFEALTNARCGVTDEETLGIRPLYRRRSSRLYRLTKLPTASSEGEVQQLDWEYGDDRGNPVRDRVRLAGECEEVIAWRANLFCVDSRHYSHGPKRTLRTRALDRKVPLPHEVVESFMSMKGHPHLRAHPKHARDLKGRGYTPEGPPRYEECEAELFKLELGTLVYACEDRGRIACFGKNVNFLWPAARSLEDLAAPFVERPPKRQQLVDADLAEATFGFAGAHGEHSHPFRGRVRFTTFWCQGTPERLPAVRLMPLTAPAGTKGKARPLYLAPVERSGAPPDTARHDESAAAARGRKMYWHQRAAGGPNAVAREHDADRSGGNLNESAAEKACPTMHPLVNAEFHGQVHFSNLTDEELGALLVALDPSLAFAPPGAEVKTHGIKLGKGKPRGLGSVAATINLRRCTPAARRYRALENESREHLAAADVQRLVKAWREWALVRAGVKDESQLGFLCDLERLLRLPTTTKLHRYPTESTGNFKSHGWMPEWNDPAGDPPKKDGRPPAMRRARDLPVE